MMDPETVKKILTRQEIKVYLRILKVSRELALEEIQLMKKKEENYRDELRLWESIASQDSGEDVKTD